MKKITIIRNKKGQFAKGSVFSYWKGKHHSRESVEKRRIALFGTHRPKEVKEKISKSRKGMKLSEEHKKNLSNATKGINNHNFGRKQTKEVVAKRLESFRKTIDRRGRREEMRRKQGASPEYVEWRTKVFNRDNWTCQTCRTRGGILQAHHIKSWLNFIELRFNVNNGVTLCKPCHVLANRGQHKREKNEK